MNGKADKTHRPGLRFTALAVAFVFTLTSVTWNSPASAAPAETAVPAFSSIEKLVIPAEIGSMRESTESGVRSTTKIQNPVLPYASRRTVILIQDAHAVIDAQENIRKILAHLRNKYGVSLAALEGAKGRLEPILLRTFPEPSVKRKVLAGYENRAELSVLRWSRRFRKIQANFSEWKTGLSDEKITRVFCSGEKDQSSIPKNSPGFS